METLREPKAIRRWPGMGSCAHANTRDDNVAGIRRSVCVECGHVSLDFRESAVDEGHLDRRRFARRQEAESGLSLDQP
ncbi:MAG: hypothetical protein R6X29_12015 [Acidimicrobiia bacterium]|jgi:hypothetical protein